MKFKFIGTDSLGFVHDTVYDLKIETTKWAGHPGEYIQIVNKRNNKICLYSSLKNFLLNWEEQNN